MRSHTALVLLLLAINLITLIKSSTQFFVAHPRDNLTHPVHYRHVLYPANLDQQTCDSVINYCSRLDKFPCLSERHKCIDRNQVCNYNKDCLDGSDEHRCPTMCSADDATRDLDTRCGWRQDNSDPADGLHWIVMAAFETLDPVNISPNIDSLGHSCGKFFALADHSQVHEANYVTRRTSKSVKFAKPVVLQSAMFSSAARSCTFSFAFVLYDNRARYYLYINYNNPNKKSKVLWSAQFVGSYKWSKVTVPIGEQTEPFRLAFLRAPAPHSSQGTMVLDAFSFDAC